MRPSSIVWFERLNILLFVVTNAIFVSVPLVLMPPLPPEMRADIKATLFAELFFPVGGLLLSLIPLGLALLVSRRRSRIAWWVVLILSLGAVPAMVRNFPGTGPPALNGLGLVADACILAAIGLLLTPSSRRWVRPGAFIPMDGPVAG